VTNDSGTRNHVPQIGSPAIDAIPIRAPDRGLYFCPVEPGHRDQRIATRQYASACDIGAVEWTPKLDLPPQK